MYALKCDLGLLKAIRFEIPGFIIWRFSLKKPLLGILLTCTVMAAPVMAQTVNYACEYVKTAGLEWKNGSWVVSTFDNMAPFILKTVDGSIVPPGFNSVGDESHPLYLAKCHEQEGLITGIGTSQTAYVVTQSCNDNEGNFLVFSFTDLTGSYSSTIGGVSPRNSNYKESLSVAPFVCETIR